MEANQIVLKNQERVLYAYRELCELNKKINENTEEDENIEQDEEKKEGKKEALTALCNKLPGYIQHNGLIRTAAFLKSNEEKEVHNAEIKRNIYRILSQWLMENYLEQEEKDLLTFLLDKENIENLNVYMLLTKEAIEFSGWLRRHQKMM